MKDKITIAVRKLAEFISDEGDLYNDFSFNSDVNAGILAHQYLQRKYNEDSLKEVFVKYDINLLENKVSIQGKIDGIIKINAKEILEEIKSTKRALINIDENYHPAHLLQLKLYMAIYALNKNLSEVSGRLTYINIDDYETKEFNYIYETKELEIFLLDSINKYLDWHLFLSQIESKKAKTVQELRFPYNKYRKGQKDLMKAVYYTLNKKDTLFASAPTGIGKTISALYPAIKSLKNENEKIMYITPKSSQKELAINQTDTMIKKGLDIKLVEITSKEKSCFLNQELCQFEKCPYAKNYFGKLKVALREILENKKIITKNIIDEYAEKYEICPFEFSLEISNYSHIIVSDYNYVFDPKVRLIRYFEDENSYKVKVLVDEAHNLVERSKDMYSKILPLSTVINLKKGLKGKKPTINVSTKKLCEIIKNKEEQFVDNRYLSNNLDEEIIKYLSKIYENAKKIFSEYEEKQFKNKSLMVLKNLEIFDFLRISELFSESHRFIIEKQNDEYILKILCLDASKFLHSTIKNKLDSIIFFSATLLPMEYYKLMLNENHGEHIIIPSPFKKDNLDLIFINKISTKFKDRDESIDNICNIVEILINSKPGNYIIYFPSYEYLNLVYDNLIERINCEIIIQEKELSILERNKIIARFSDILTPKLGMFVMGGVFSEGLDFIGDKLSGVIVVGLGIPQVNFQNELTNHYFEKKFSSGYLYTYLYPGFNKVLQAAGRVIRTEEDKGVVIVIDSRITTAPYLTILPSYWSHFKRINGSYDLQKELLSFWHKNN